MDAVEKQGGEDVCLLLLWTGTGAAAERGTKKRTRNASALIPCTAVEGPLRQVELEGNREMKDSHAKPPSTRSLFFFLFFCSVA